MRKQDIITLVDELKTQQVQKRDLVVPSRCLSVKNGLVNLRGVSENKELDQTLAALGIASSPEETWQLAPMPNAHSQLCEKLDLPRKYYDKMLLEKSTQVYDHTLSYWLAQQPGNYFVRTFVNADGGVGRFRALLGDNYKVIDHLDVLIAALEAVQAMGVNLNIEYCDLTENKMYVRFVAPDVEVFSPVLVDRYRTPDGNRKDGGSNAICSGFVLSNSEIGQGKFAISPRAVVGACSNGMIFTNDAYKRMHMGSKMEEYSFIKWSEETRRLDSELIISQVKDAVNTFISEDYLGKQIQLLEEQGAQKLEHPVDAVKNVCRHLDIPEERITNVLNYFTEGGDTRRFGITQALTYFAHTDAGADMQYELEHAAVALLPKMKEFDRKEIMPKKGESRLVSK